MNFSDISEEKRERINDINQQSEPLNDRLEAIEKDHNTAKRNQAHYKEKKQEYQVIFGEKKTAMEQKKEKYEKQLERAESFSKSPFETKRKAEAIFRELQVTEESIKRAEKAQEPKELVERKYREIRVFFNGLTQQIECLRDTVKYLDSMLRQVIT